MFIILAVEKEKKVLGIRFYLIKLLYQEIKERYGAAPNVQMECHECVSKYTTPMAEACPEWDKECKLQD